MRNYIVGRYISIKKLIEATKDFYYESLQASSQEWHEEKKISKPGRVEEEIKNNLGTITKSELMKKVSDVSQTKIQRTLTELISQRKIKKIGNGRYTKYAWNWESE